MSTIRGIGISALFLTVTAAFGQDEHTDPYAELGLIEQSIPVADEPAEPGGSDESAGEPPTEKAFLAEYGRFVALLQEQNYDEADIAAKRVIEMAIRLYGRDSYQTAKALNNLGVVQNNNRQYEAAMQNFASSVEILEILEDRLNLQLINPLKGLGAAQLGSGRPDLAAHTFGRAAHITHVNEGPHNVEQVELLESQAEASVRMGDIETARDLLDRIHILNVRHFAGNSIGLLPSLMRRADWQHRAGYYSDERATYRRAIRIIEEAAGKDDPRLVDPLVKLASSLYFYDTTANGSFNVYSTTSGETYLKRAERIAERSSGFPWLDLAKTKLALADYYIVAESYTRARTVYSEVRELLSADDERLEMRNELLERPHPIWQKPLPAATSGAANSSTRKNDIRPGTVTVTYTVSPRGRARIEKVVAEPPEFVSMQRMVQREILRRIYRPQFEEQGAIRSAPQTIRHEFKYSTNELESLRKQAEEQQETADEE
ncbi:MAG: tetratricopeptide repeat protein [Gammaproteobacteria bacterium]|nr:tetratricopeptide repeat protein [Gammaproteobacteria bacterium]NNF48308.1 tetratricopeptide repeat protein [Woeseiaceae bacterium]MBT8093922.1 tetratricopeptide repeat protein [Gammaproteobacteria bacterium]MBT8105498.1 tetratricopeptide repeat protein [Gammaproteobacteria bacterium]NNK25512.1 tetratricopeptide repeat protein [Woeseiaceae bacterium]